ncbi:MAG: hypothetical protein ABIW38_07485 [Ferruginibacter sp.]
MKTSITVISLVFFGFITLLLLKKRIEEGREMVKHASDEGYETAHDILYPGKKNRSRHLRYGPVLPHTRP